MQRGLSLVELAAKITEQQKLKADYIAPASELTMDVTQDGKPTMLVPVPGADELTSFDVQQVAHDQLATKTNIPARYYNRMLAEDPQLLANNVNRWLSTDPDRRMVRTVGGKMRAFLSDRYARIENEEIAEVALPILMETPGIEIVAAEVTERKLYLMATTARVQGDVGVGDVVQAGVCISNSEVGLGAAQIKPMLFRLVCKNGLILPDAKLTARHVGRRIGEGEDLNAIYADDTRRADDNALLLKVRDVVKHAMDEVSFNRTIERFTEMKQGRIENDPAKSVEVLAKKVGFNEGERKSILQSLLQDGDMNAFGLINAVTYQAHTAERFDRAVEIEEAAGQMLTLSKSDWREILEAA